jgi:hypothetical protein
MRFVRQPGAFPRKRLMAQAFPRECDRDTGTRGHPRRRAGECVAPRRVAAAFPRNWVSPSLPLISRASSESAMELTNFALAPRAWACKRPIGSLRRPGSARLARSGKVVDKLENTAGFSPTLRLALWPHGTSGGATWIPSSAETRAEMACAGPVGGAPDQSRRRRHLGRRFRGNASDLPRSAEQLTSNRTARPGFLRGN